MMKGDDFKLLRGFASWRMDKRTDKRTFVIVESLLRLKIVFFKVKTRLLKPRFSGNKLAQLQVGFRSGNKEVAIILLNIM